jgi:hypothetical protein
MFSSTVTQYTLQVYCGISCATLLSFTQTCHQSANAVLTTLAGFTCTRTIYIHILYVATYCTPGYADCALHGLGFYGGGV